MWLTTIRAGMCHDGVEHMRRDVEDGAGNVREMGPTRDPEYPMRMLLSGAANLLLGETDTAETRIDDAVELITDTLRRALVVLRPGTPGSCVPRASQLGRGQDLHCAGLVGGAALAHGGLRHQRARLRDRRARGDPPQGRSARPRAPGAGATAPTAPHPRDPVVHGRDPAGDDRVRPRARRRVRCPCVPARCRGCPAPPPATRAAAPAGGRGPGAPRVAPSRRQPAQP